MNLLTASEANQPFDVTTRSPAHQDGVSRKNGTESGLTRQQLLLSFHSYRGLSDTSARPALAVGVRVDDS